MADDDKRKTSGTVNFEEARERGRVGNEYWDKQYQPAQDDLQFLAGKQWSVQDRSARQGRITLTINDLGQYTDRIIGDLRQNPTAINVIPADFGASKSEFISTSGRKYPGTEVIAGLIRQIEYKCNAKYHYSMAGQHAVESGLGWLRLYSDYSDMVSFNQDLRIERIKNRFSVVADPMATEPDHSDQNWVFIGDWVKRSEFDRKFPGRSASQIAETLQESSRAFWGKEGYVRVTEYYWREEFSFQIAQLDNGEIITDGEDLITEDEQEEAKRLWALAEAGKRITRQRKHKSFRVKWAKITYHDVLEGPYTLPGTIIPVAPVIGKRIEGDSDTFHYGIIRFAKEPKQMENYWLSSATERIAQMPKSPWLVTATHIKGYENEWLGANFGNKPYLPFNPDVQAPQGPQRQIPPTIPAGELQMMISMREMVRGSIGLHDAAIGKDTNQQSGRALNALANAANVGSFVFTDNLSMAVSYIGRALLEWIPSIYDAERLITIRHENGESDTIPLNEIVDGKLVNDMKAGTYDQHVTTGPAYATLRQQSSEAMAQFFQYAPDALPAMMDLFLEAQDWPGAKLMAKRARKMIPPNLLDESELTPEEKEAAAQPPQPTPEEQVAMADAESRMATAEATKAKAQATIVTAEASVAKSQNEMVISDNKVESQKVDTVRQAVEASAPKPEAAPAKPAPAESENPEDAPVTQEEFGMFKTELVGMLAGLSREIQSLKGAN